MKFFRFLISGAITIVLFYFLNSQNQTPIGPIPPLGKFLDPFNGFWQNAEENHGLDKHLVLDGITEAVDVVYDSLLIPHIFAKNDEDLYFAQGYVTANHRLWQMEFQTHAAAGRISEIIGGAAINFDKTQRRKGMVFGANNSLKVFRESEITSRLVKSYSDGINAYITSLEYKDYPLEYKLMDYSPEKWEPFKTALLLKSMANTLNISEKDLQNTNFLNLYGLERLNLLYPDWENVSDPIVDLPGKWDFEPVTIDSLPLAIPDELIELEPVAQPDPITGSNNWAISGSKTKTGQPILSNDPHLTLNLPSIWFVAQLNAPGINTMGATLPGSPNVIIGFNDSIAWGQTNADRDLVDWFLIEFQDESADRYKLDGIWVPTQKVIEEIKIKGQEPVYDTIIYTHWGPVMYDKNFRSDNEKKNYAFRWIAHDESNEGLAFYYLNRADNHSDYLEALNYFESPAQNFAFASVSGDIAMKVQGKFPVRRENEGRFLLDGSNSLNGWQAFIPNEHNVMYKNPERGFISSANQYPVDSTYPYYIMARNYEAFRNRRINFILDSLEAITVDDLKKLQNDNFNMIAFDVLSTLLDFINEPTLNAEEKTAYRTLKDWELYNEPTLEAPAYFEEFWNQIFLFTWDEIRNADVALKYPSDYTTIQLIKSGVEIEFFDLKETPEREKLADIIHLAFVSSVQNIEDWKSKNGDDLNWADYKNTYVQHLAQLAPFSTHVKNGGDGHIVNATSGTHGPSWRMIVSLEKPEIKAWGVYPGGQSGNPGNPYYLNLIKHWEVGDYYRLQFYHNSNTTENSMLTQQLNPGK